MSHAARDPGVLGSGWVAWSPVGASLSVRSIASAALLLLICFPTVCLAVPRSLDFDGDGKADIAVYRKSTSTFFVRRSSDAVLSQIPFNLTSTAPIVTPVPADYTGDGKADAAIWGSQQCLTGEPTPSPPAPAPIPAFFCPQGGGGTGLGNVALDLPVPADYDGDGKADFAVYRKTTGVWTVQRSSGGTITVSWGAPALGDTPVPADYDGDGKADVAVYRKLTGEWLIRRSSDGGVTVVAGRRTSETSPFPRTTPGTAGRTSPSTGGSRANGSSAAPRTASSSRSRGAPPPSVTSRCRPTTPETRAALLTSPSTGG